MCDLIGPIFCVVHIIGNIIFTIVLSSAAIRNYPGGEAIIQLHTFENCNLNANFSVHISNLPAQTGVTRFTQLSDMWM